MRDPTMMVELGEIADVIFLFISHASSVPPVMEMLICLLAIHHFVLEWICQQILEGLLLIFKLYRHWLCLEDKYLMVFVHQFFT